MSRENLKFGCYGEKEAASFLEGAGYRVIARNYRARSGEIDIIASDKDTLCFIEVKSRKNSKFGFAQEAVSYAKQRSIAKTAILFLKEKRLLGEKARFDVVCIDHSQPVPKISLIKNAFELDSRYTY